MGCIEENTSNDKVKAVSPVTISNREFADKVINADFDGDGQMESYKTAVYSTVQLRKAEVVLICLYMEINLQRSMALSV